MTEINTDGSFGRAYRNGSSRRVKKHSLRSDMTPMVDLGFLLISFFVFTAQLSEPRSLKLNMPKNGSPIPVAKSAALTFLLGKNDAVFYYEGDWQQAFEQGNVLKTNYSVKGGLGSIVRKKQKQLDESPVNGERREGLMVMIKAGKNASYKNVVDVLDEMLINGVKKYVLLSSEPEETIFLGDK